MTLNRKLNEYSDLEHDKKTQLATMDAELTRKKNALVSAQTELRRIEADLAEF